MVGFYLGLGLLLCNFKSNLHQQRTLCGLLGGGVGTPYDGLHGEARGGGTFFRLQVYERVGILLVEVSVIWVCERAQRANR